MITFENGRYLLKRTFHLYEGYHEKSYEEMKTAQCTPHHTLVFVYEYGGTELEALYVDDVLIASENWKWKQHKLYIEFSQGKGDDHLSGEFWLGANHCHTRGYITVGQG